MKTCVVFNSKSGMAGQARDVIERISRRTNCQLCPLERREDTARLIRESIAKGVKRVVVAGGDGTVASVVNSLAPNFDAVELAILPLGTGNDLARALGIFNDRLGTASDLAFGGRTHLIDVVRVQSDKTFYFVNCASGGFGGKVAIDVQEIEKHRWGSFAYWMTALADFMQMQPFDVQLDLDDQTRELAVYGLVVANGIYVGGGFAIAPSAKLDDGLLDITAIPVLPVLELLAEGLNFALGGALYPSSLLTIQAQRVHVQTTPNMPFSFDGEPSQHVDAVFEVLPRALRVVVGEQPPGVTL